MPKTVVVGVSGGIAAYKAVGLVSTLKKRGYDVHVIMTQNAQEFVTPLTFEMISGNAAVIDTFKREDTYDVKHISLAQKADMFIVAPATANVMGKVAGGIADDMLTTTLMAAKCPVVFAPAMNTAMYMDDATQQSIKVLKKRGAYVMDTGTGALACGDVGAGRMREPDEIIAYMDDVFLSLQDMHGVKVLVSAGPTREAIDPVRFLSNRSSGKMGYAIAQAAVDRGADVAIVSGPVALELPQKADVVNVSSAAQMNEAMQAAAKDADIVIMTAAVADYTPEEASAQKIKKGGDMALKLVRTVDVLAALGENKPTEQLLVGFAAETENCVQNARNKLQRKNLDVIALNDVSRSGEGFGADENNITLFFADGSEKDLGSADKATLARQIIDEIFKLYQNQSTAG